MKAFIFFLVLCATLTMASVGLRYIDRPAGIIALVAALLFGWLAKAVTQWTFLIIACVALSGCDVDRAVPEKHSEHTWGHWGDAMKEGTNYTQWHHCLDCGKSEFRNVGLTD